MSQYSGDYGGLLLSISSTAACVHLSKTDDVFFFPVDTLLMTSPIASDPRISKSGAQLSSLESELVHCNLKVEFKL